MNKKGRFHDHNHHSFTYLHRFKVWRHQSKQEAIDVVRAQVELVGGVRRAAGSNALTVIFHRRDMHTWLTRYSYN